MRTAGATSATQGGTVSQEPILEREQELATIDDVLSVARKGTGALVLVDAHAGIGKSALLAKAAARGAEAGMGVLTARASELEREHSFGVVLQLLEPPLAKATEDEREDLLSGAAALARPLLEGEIELGASPDEQLFGILHGLYWVVSNLAESAPLLIAADDAHWTDRSSLRFFLYLAQRLRDLPVVLLTSARPAEPGAPEDLLVQLRTHDATRLMRPAALSPDGVARLLEGRMPRAEPEFVSACARVTGGNPYLLNELLAELEQRGVEPVAEQAAQVGRLAPDSVLEGALVRLIRLPSGASEIARAVAVLSDDATLENAAALSGLDPEQAGPAVDALVAAELLRPGRPLAFVHPLLHSAIYEQIPPADRGELHGRAARLVAEKGAPDETVSAHLLSATGHGDPWAVERLRGAARRSLAQGAADSAVRYLTRALEEPSPRQSRSEVLLELGTAESLTGMPEAVARLDQALELVAEPRRRAEILRELGWTLQKQGDMRAAVAAFERGLSQLADLPDEDEAARLERANLETAHLGAAMLEPSSAEEAQRQLAEVRAKPATAHGPAEREVLAMFATQLVLGGQAHEEAISLSLEAWGDGALLERGGSDSHSIWHVIGTLSWSDALDPAEELLEATLETAQREGSIVTMALGFYARAWPRFWRGDLAGCAADAEAAISAWSGDYSMYLPVAAYWYALAQIELDDVDSAAAALDFPDAQERWGRSNMYGAVLTGRGLVALARDRSADAVELLEQAGRSVLGSMIANPGVIPWCSWLSEARLANGDRDGARAIAQEEVELARRFGAARPLGIALRASGLAEGGAEGLALLEEAVSTLRRSPSRFELARALVELGGALRRAGRRGEAREPLREALEMADAFGAVRLGRRAHEELVASGAHPRRRELSGAASLTPGELRVAKLAASGMTNREIAQSLFVTVKAVQWHLRNAYRKLEVEGREQLHTALDAD